MVKKFKYVSLALVGLMFLLLGQPVVAAERIVTPQSYDYMAFSNCNISVSGSRVMVYGETQTSKSVDKIVTTVYLEKETSSGGWTTVDSWTKTVYNTSYCEAGGSKTVTPGYYRARCSHKVYQGNLVETNYSESTKSKVN
jgi:rRNA processing protein Krr1/Pno1